MKPFAVAITLASLLAALALAAEDVAQLSSMTDAKRQLRISSDPRDSTTTDVVVLGSSRSKSRLVAVSGADDDAAVMATAVKKSAQDPTVSSATTTGAEHDTP